jgi:hypothetical protein
MQPQPGGGLGTVAATLERGLCAEDLVTVYRARNGSMERSEFAGHRACPPEPPPAPAAAKPSAKAPPPRPAPAPPKPRVSPELIDPFSGRF